MPQKIECNGLRMAFGNDSQRCIVFDGLDFRARDGEVVAILGPSGCGKTTLLNLLAGFLVPDSGEVLVDGVPVVGPDAKRAAIFQEDAVFPWLTVAENVGYGLRIRGVETEASRNAVVELIGAFGLREQSHRYPVQLSGGQLKRVDVARAFANSPDVLLMDEPFGSLDPSTRQKLWSYLAGALAKLQTTTLLVTHDVEEALWLADRILILSEAPAKVVEETRVPFERPRNLSIRFEQEFQALRKRIAEGFTL